MFLGYEKYLAEFDTVINNYFKEQKPYIFCKKGCSLCCFLGEYPMSQLEFSYLFEGYKKLDLNTQKIIKNRIKKLKMEYLKYKNSLQSSKFEHKCPFLIGDSCAVYSYRALVCRTFGLIKKARTVDGYDVAILPDCVHQGLNYSNVYDPLKNQFDNKKIKAISQKTEPIAYDITLQSIYENGHDKNIVFENRKNMIDFILEFDL